MELYPKCFSLSLPEKDISPDGYDFPYSVDRKIERFELCERLDKLESCCNSNFLQYSVCLVPVYDVVFIKACLCLIISYFMVFL